MFNQWFDIFDGHYLIVMALAFLGAHGHQYDRFSCFAAGGIVAACIAASIVAAAA